MTFPLLAVLFAVGVGAADHEPPAIEHVPLSRAARGSPVEIEAVISDPSGVFAPQVLARSVGTRRYFAFPMEDRGGGAFAATLPQSFFAGGAFEYFIEAYDELGNGPARAGSPEKPVKVELYDAPPRPARLVLRTDPPDARVEVDGETRPDAARGLTIRAGAHAVVVSAPLRRPALYQLDLAPGGELHLLVSLAEGRGAGTLRVQSDPPGAQVFLDAALLGTTPYAGPLQPGAHALAVELAGHLRQERRVVLEGGHDVEQSFALPVLPRGPALSVASDPPGALVSIDGVGRGSTPFIGALSAGPHQLVLRQQGRREKSSDFVMPADRDLSLRLDLPEPEGKPQLLVATQPAGATLAIDGSEAGLTPWSGPLAQGPHSLEVRLSGYLPQKRTVAAVANRDVEADFALLPEPGPAQLVVETDPAGAKVLVDDKPAGLAPATAKLEPGEHQISAALQGYGEVVQRLTVVAGQRASMRLLLPPASKSAPVVEVNTQPAGARVSLDGKPLGISPARSRVEPGPHELSMSMDGYKERTARFTMPEHRDVQLVLAVSLKPLRESDSKSAPDSGQVARARVERGRACFKKGDFACARAELEGAHRLAPSPELLFETAQAQRKAGALADAAAAYRAFLKAAPGSALAAQAGKLAALCEAGKIGAAADEDTEPPAIVHLPLREASRGQPLRLAATIRDDKSGVLEPRACLRNFYSTAWECLPLAAGERDEYSVQAPARLVADGLAYYLEAYDGSLNGPSRAGSPDAPFSVALKETTPARPAGAVTAAPPQALPTVAANPVARRSRAVAWAAAGAGAAALIAGGVFALSARNLTQHDTTTVVNGVTYHSITQANAQRASSRSAAADAFLAAGAGLVIAGGAFLWLSPSAAGVSGQF